MGVLYIIGLVVFVAMIFYLVLMRYAEQFDSDGDFSYEAESLKDALSQMEVKDYIMIVVKIIIVLFVVYSFNYFILLKLHIRYLSLYLLILFTILLVINFTYKNTKMSSGVATAVSIVVTSVFVLIAVFYGVFGGRTYFHAEAYSNLIDVQEETFSSDVQTVDVDTLPIVDKSYGAKLGALKLGEFPGIGSEFEAGYYSDIIYNGQQYLVAPLEYRGIIKWLNNRSIGTPGYIMINKVTTETTLVNLTATDNEGLVYTPSAYFGQDLQRHAYMNGMSSYQLEETYFEIDESGKPYYVMQYSRPTIFINGGKDIAKIAVVDAIDGTIGIYDPDEVPVWVESVYPSTIVLQQLNYWGTLQDGWLNSFLAQEGVLRPSDGKRTVMNDGELYYFTGLTSAGNDESTIGFVYMNTRTKETKLFQFPGATEQAAMNKAITLLPQNNIFTSFPIPINVADVPTYFILIKGEDGRILRHVFIGVQNLELYEFSETKDGAYAGYLTALGNDNVDTLDIVTGTITSITSYVNEGSTIFWIELDGVDLYMLRVDNFEDEEMMIFVTKAIGDELSIKANDFTVIELVEDE